METAGPELMTVDDLCETLMIGRSTAYQLMRSGDLGAFRIGRIWKIPRAGVLDYLHEMRQGRKKEP